jgi:AraC family transcriptional regulator, transcriptional activator FtrA
MRAKAAKPEVAVVVYDGVTLFELAVACEVFGEGSGADLDVPWYRLTLCTTTPGPVATDGGLPLHIASGLAPIGRAGTVIVPPTERLDDVPAEVFEALRLAHARGARILSLCTGAFVLARAGLLDERPATTHWSSAGDLARTYPRVSVDAGVLFVDDGDILTSAGSAASIDLCLHVVRRDHGAEIATRLARQMVVPPQRDGGQAQFIEAPLPDPAGTDLFAETVAWSAEHLHQPLTVEDLAARSAMSPRTFARRFGAGMGTTPYQWLLRQRIHLAQRLLEMTDLGVDAVAEQSGFGSAANLRRQFGRSVRTSPQAYRRMFQERRG